jgi:pSer/pThr/pTyr-binding forkhead associated (FHA) protein
MASALRFKQTNVPRQAGELARLKVIQGPDASAVYILLGAHITLGRGEDCDVILSDLKASRLHAELIANAGSWTIRDKGSANGILFNGKSVREIKLKIKDVITLGETTLEFTTSEVATMMLTAPPRTMDEVQSEQKLVAARQEKMQAMGIGAIFGFGSGPSLPRAAGRPEDPNANRNRVGILAIVVAALFYIFWDSGEKVRSVASKRMADPAALNLAAYLPNAEINKAADTLFKDGFREYLAGNYNRARTQFDTVLQIAPTHTLARLYQVNCDKAIQNEVNLNLTNGKQSFNSGKLKDARSHFERVMRLLYKDQSNSNYIEAREFLDKVLKKISGVEVPN